MKKILTILKWLTLLIIVSASSLYFYQDVETKELNPETRKMLGGDFLETKQGVIHYHLEGDHDAELVVLVHGFGVASYVWQQTFQFLLKQGYRVLSFDLFGHGFSDRPNVDYNMELYSNEINSLLNGLEIDRPIHLVGLSMGGPAAARFTHLHPDRVYSLILQDPLVNQVDVSKIKPLDIAGIGEYLMTIYLMPKYIAEHKNDPSRGKPFSNWGDLYRQQAGYKGFRHAILGLIRNMATQPFIEEYQQLAKIEQSDLAKLLIWGSNDPTIPISEAQFLTALMPNMEYQVIEGGGHVSSTNKPQKFNAIMLDFLKKHPIKVISATQSD